MEKPAPLNNERLVVSIVVMQIKRFTGLAVCCLLVLISAAYLKRSSTKHPQARPSVFLAGQQRMGDSVSISVALSNPGPRVLSYAGSLGSPFIDVIWPIGDDGTCANAQRKTAPRPGFYFLLPGEAVTETFVLPLHITNCQVGCQINYAGQRTALGARLLKSKCGRAVFPVAKHVLQWVSNEDAKTVETWTKVALKTRD